MSEELRRGRSVVHSLSYHLVFVTKYRRGAIASERVRACLKQAFESVCTDLGGSLKECDGEDDHLHLLVEMPPKIAPSVMVNSLKGVSSRLLRSADFPEVRAKLYGDHFWSPSYFVASTGGATLDTVKAYIHNQRQGGASSRT